VRKKRKVPLCIPALPERVFKRSLDGGPRIENTVKKVDTVGEAVELVLTKPDGEEWTVNLKEFEEILLVSP
jgi:hypothetical protein